MVNLKEIKWDAIKELCDKVAGIESRAKELGLNYIFTFDVGIYPCKVFSVLYKKIDGSTDINLAKYSENNYFEKKEEFDAHLAKVEKILTVGWSVDKAYAEELAKLNKKYGK
jgi:hypothetical protein